ncbi:hypothetical protein [Serratia symbiotica]|uniref:Uncharacterized protein n=1 Tax=Serratia symbiotica TaxID=138074 RepID=A0A068ZC08_9GAMM|nr:hypothetical protein [Serratia symbiotica]MBF1995208.1 hypothetical protein [Serratia symbiotica]MBQ0956880.1 hypothetical protein [Serratia symbiotica]QLH62373.1 hypothetical protein SYMBAF_04685 [Serratia symbiotica]QLH64538.1 hypothetical protein SYMBAF_17095 [Serratia symbiotica]QTP13590.1 hypothetical protein GPZ83_0008865 [Serratia symbiotica]
MKLSDLPEGVQVVAAETLSQIIAMNVYDEDNTLERADFITKAFLALYQREHKDC